MANKIQNKSKSDLGNINVGAFANPLKYWPNDDILLSDKSREYIKDTQPELLRVLDWPELRQEFHKHDKPGLKAKQLNRISGLVAVFCSALGLILAALSPLFPIETLLRITAEVLLLIGVFFGIWHLWRAKQKSAWLGHRYWTERLRQFYFQFLINNLDLAAKAIHNDPAKAEYDELRRKELAELLKTKNDTAYVIENLVSDIAETSPWIQSDWVSPKIPGRTDKYLDLLISILGKQRIGIQEEYVSKKIKPGTRSPVSRATFVTHVSDLSTFAVVILGIVMGVLILSFDFKFDNTLVALCLSFSAVFSTLILFLRVMDEALCLRVSAERYKWYLAATREVKNRFQHAPDVETKISLLREMEHLSYQELRRFIASHKSARFVL